MKKKINHNRKLRQREETEKYHNKIGFNSYFEMTSF